MDSFNSGLKCDIGGLDARPRQFGSSTRYFQIRPSTHGRNISLAEQLGREGIPHFKEESRAADTTGCMETWQLVAFLWWQGARCQFTVKGRKIQVSYPLGFLCVLTCLFSSWMTFWEASCLLRELSSCVELCLTCALRFSFSSSSFRKFSFDCLPITEQSPEKRYYPLALAEAHPSFPHRPHSGPCSVLGFLSSPHLPLSPSLPLLLSSKCPQLLYPARPGWTHVWPCIYGPDLSQILLLTIFSLLFSSCRNDSISCSSNFSRSLLFFSCSRFSSSNLITSLSSSSRVVLVEDCSLC